MIHPFPHAEASTRISPPAPVAGQPALRTHFLNDSRLFRIWVMHQADVQIGRASTWHEWDFVRITEWRLAMNLSTWWPVDVCSNVVDLQRHKPLHERTCLRKKGKILSHITLESGAFPRSCPEVGQAFLATAGWACLLRHVMKAQARDNQLRTARETSDFHLGHLYTEYPYLGGHLVCGMIYQAKFQTTSPLCMALLTCAALRARRQLQSPGSPQRSLLLRGIPLQLAGIGLLPSMLSVRPQQQHPATGKLCCRQVGPSLQELLPAQHECGSKIAMRRRSVSNKISCIVEISTSKVFYKAPTCCMTPTCTRTDFICLPKPKTVAPPNILPSQVVQHAPLRIFRSLQPRGWYVQLLWLSILEPRNSSPGCQSWRRAWKSLRRKNSKRTLRLDLPRTLQVTTFKVRALDKVWLAAHVHFLGPSPPGVVPEVEERPARLLRCNGKQLNTIRPQVLFLQNWKDQMFILHRQKHSKWDLIILTYINKMAISF